MADHRHWRHPQRQVEEGKPGRGRRGRGVKRHATGLLLVGPCRRRRGHLVAVLERQPLVGDVAERRGHDDDRARGDERAGHAATDNLALPRGQEGGEAGGPRGRGRRQEGAGEGEDLEPALERGDRAEAAGPVWADCGWRSVTLATVPAAERTQTPRCLRRA